MREPRGDQCSHGRSLYSEECLVCDAIWHRQAIADLERHLVKHRTALERVLVTLAATNGTVRT